MLGLFNFNWQTNYLLIPIISAISFDCRYFISNKLNADPYFNSMIMSVSQMVFGFALSYFEYKKKYAQERPCKKLWHIRYDILFNFASASLDIVSFTGINFLIKGQKNIKQIPLILRMIQLLFLCCFGKVFLKIELYRYHYLSMIITFICLLLLILIEEIYTNPLNLLYYLLSYMLNCMRHVLNKKQMIICFSTAFQEIMYQGIISLIELFIYVFICSFCFRSETITYEKMFKFESFDWQELLYLVIIFITGGLYNILNTRNNEVLSLLHVGIGDTIGAFIFIYVKEWTVPASIIDLLLIVIIFISCLICTEVIICHLCSMTKDSTNEIIRRGTSEHLGLDEIINQAQMDEENDITLTKSYDKSNYS